MKPGVYKAVKKDGCVYYRSSITYKNKHISLGSFSSEAEAHLAYKEAGQVFNDTSLTLTDYKTENPLLSFKKWVVLINFRDNNLYIKTPIYLKNRFFHYYISPERYYIFDTDDLFYYSTHSIMIRGGHLFVSDYGMQVNILSRYGIKNFAVAGRDYRFSNGNPYDFRYENIEIINRFYGVTSKLTHGKQIYTVKVHVKGNIFVGTYLDEITAAVAYNKAVTLLIKKGIHKEFPFNYIEEISNETYHKIYKEVHLSKNIMKYQFRTKPYKAE